MPRREKILSVLRRLYEDISRWQGLWAEFVGGSEGQRQLRKSKVRNSKGPWGEVGQEELDFLSAFEELLTGQPSNGTPRWAILAITATVQVARRYPSETTENWKFLEALVDKL